MRKILLAIIVLFSIAICFALVGLGYLFFMPANQVVGSRAPILVSSQTTITPRPAKPLTAPTPLHGMAAVIPTVVNDGSTLGVLTSLETHPSDRVRLAQEYRGVVALAATPAAPKKYNIGDKETFWVSRDMQSDNEQVTATLRYMNDVVYMWTEDGERFNDADLKASADVFANQIYPTNRKYLGSEASPGVDNDTHLTILNARLAPQIGGYFSQSDSLPLSIKGQSNEREMFYINSRGSKPGTTNYNSTLAHEFAHMVHRNNNQRGEGSWISEGFGDLGMELNGFSTGHQESFLTAPDLQLNAWAAAPDPVVPHYGAAYLFLSYQLNRFGIDYIRDVFSSDKTGIAWIQNALDKHQPGMTFDQLYADWVAANYLNDPSFGPQYNYSPEALNMRPTFGYSKYPTQGGDTVHQYGTDYIQLLSNGKDVTVTFDGSDSVRAIPTDPFSGKYFWWSGRTDLTDSRLSREIDLTAVDKATLNFRTWYNLEPDYDYGYVSVSTDGGKTWQSLKGTTTTTADPNAQNYGNAFTCKSGASCANLDAEPQWIQESIDLTPYAGKKVLLQFQQVTDEVYTEPGLAIDDIEIPEIGFKDDAENGDNGWTADGFARIDNVLPQKFIVQAIEFGSTPRVVSIPLDAQNRGSYTTSKFGNGLSRVVLTVSGSTPITWEEADYQFQVQ